MTNEIWDEKDVEKAIAGTVVDKALPTGEILRLRRGRTTLVIDKIGEGFYTKRTERVGVEGRRNGHS